MGADQLESITPPSADSPSEPGLSPGLVAQTPATACVVAPVKLARKGKKTVLRNPCVTTAGQAVTVRVSGKKGSKEAKVSSGEGRRRWQGDPHVWAQVLADSDLVGTGDGDCGGISQADGITAASFDRPFVSSGLMPAQRASTGVDVAVACT